MHTPPPNLDHQLVGIGEKRQGAKRETGREVRRPQALVPCKQRSVMTEESIRVPVEVLRGRKEDRDV